jgi:hypothetical protein
MCLHQNQRHSLPRSSLNTVIQSILLPDRAKEADKHASAQSFSLCSRRESRFWLVLPPLLSLARA